MSVPAYSRRINAFKDKLIKIIPRVPNNRESLKAIESLGLCELLRVYLTWRLRLVGQRPRQVVGLLKLQKDPRYLPLRKNIQAFLEQVRLGGDLLPYLSLRVVSRGYAPAAYTNPPTIDRNEDKDQLLYAIGLHHFHLGLKRESAGHQERTDEVMLAFVSRDKFDILGLFSHDVFERLDDGSMTNERNRMWSFYEKHRAKMNPNGGFYMGGLGGMGITTAGTPTVSTIAAIRHVQIIRSVDPKLDDRDFVRKFYGASDIPSRPKLEWAYHHLDLGLVDEKAKFFGYFERGPT
jgi:hypothetical protein